MASSSLKNSPPDVDHRARLGADGEALPVDSRPAAELVSQAGLLRLHLRPRVSHQEPPEHRQVSAGSSTLRSLRLAVTCVAI